MMGSRLFGLRQGRFTTKTLVSAFSCGLEKPPVIAPMSFGPRGAGDRIGRESPNSPYAMKVVTFEEDQGAYDQFGVRG